MKGLRRFLGWLGLRRSRAAVLRQDRRFVLSENSIVGSRLRELADVEWPGSNAVFDIGQVEGELRSLVRDLTRLELLNSAIATQAAELHRAIESFLDRKSRFAILISAWPSNWSVAEGRFGAVNHDLQRLLNAARSLLDTHSQALQHRQAYEALRTAYEGAEPLLWARTAAELDLAALMDDLTSPVTVRSFAHRLSLAEAVLKDGKAILDEELDAMQDGLRYANYDSTRECGVVETEVARLRRWIPSHCEVRIAASGREVGTNCITHLERLVPASDRKLRNAAREVFQLQPVGPLLLWAKLHHSTISATAEASPFGKQKRTR